MKTINGYVARDPDDSLWFHFNKPKLMKDSDPTWYGSNDMTFRIYDFKFPEFKSLKFEDGPVKVKLTIEIQ